MRLYIAIIITPHGYLPLRNTFNQHIMKTILTLCACFALSFAAVSQTITINNTTLCTVYVKLTEYDASCAGTNTIWHMLTPGQTGLTVTPSMGTEFHRARIVNDINAAVPPCFILDVAPSWSGCVALPNTASNTGCCLNNPTIVDYVGTQANPELNIYP